MSQKFSMETLLSSRDTLAMKEPRKVKDSTEKCSVIKLTYWYTYDIPIGRMPVSKLNHGALLSNIFNFAKCVASHGGLSRGLHGLVRS